jgi:hypothetical protein
MSLQPAFITPPLFLLREGRSCATPAFSKNWGEFRQMDIFKLCLAGYTYPISGFRGYLSIH